MRLEDIRSSEEELATRWLTHLSGRPGLHGLQLGHQAPRWLQWIVSNVLQGDGSLLQCLRSDTAVNEQPSQSLESRKVSWGNVDDLVIRPVANGRRLYDFVLLGSADGRAPTGEQLQRVWQRLRPGGILICSDPAGHDSVSETRLALQRLLDRRDDWLALDRGADLVLRRRSNIEAVVTCVDYDDYLQHTLPLLARCVDRVVVVTSPLDQATAEIVDKCPLAELLVTDSFYQSGARFRKAAAINEGLQQLDKEAWVLLVDADIAIDRPLPCISDAGKLWGASRRGVTGLEAFGESVYRCSGVSATRPAARGRRNGMPLGYFQLWHWPSRPVLMNVQSSTAAAYDRQHARQWSRSDWQFLRDYSVLHLQMPDVRYGINWQGRKSRRFGAVRSSAVASGRSQVSDDPDLRSAAGTTSPGDREPAPSRGVLTAANSDYWPILRLQVQSVVSAGEQIAVVDHGFTDGQRQWLIGQGAHLPKIDDPIGFDTPGRGVQRVEPISPGRAWIKPWLCLNSPFEQTIWIDADAIVIRGLQRLFRLLAEGDWLTFENWGNQRASHQLYQETVRALSGNTRSTRYHNARRINSGVFGFTRGQSWLQSWWDVCQEITSRPELLSRCRLRDQAALVATMCRLDREVPVPRILNDRGVNWPANGLPVGQGRRRKRYAWNDSGVMRQLLSDHPDASIVHWMGAPKPWIDR